MKPMTVRTQLRKLRLDPPRQSQQELADALGVSRQTIIAIEKGRYTPSLSLALQIAKYYGLTVEEIFSLEADA